MNRRWPVVVLIVLVAALIAAIGVLLTREGDSPPVGDEPRGVTAEQVFELAADTGHPIYWLGERDGTEYELTESSNGRIYIRYLDGGAMAGDPRDDFVTVGTYPADAAVAALRRAAGNRVGSELGRTDDGAVLLIDPSSPNNAHLAYPGAKLQIEVFSPVPGDALRFASGGGVQPVP